MEKVCPAQFRFSIDERQLLEDAYLKGAKSAQDARLLAKTLGYEETRIINWIYKKEGKEALLPKGPTSAMRIQNIYRKCMQKIVTRIEKN